MNLGLNIVLICILVVNGLIYFRLKDALTLTNLTQIRQLGSATYREAVLRYEQLIGAIFVYFVIAWVFILLSPILFRIDKITFMYYCIALSFSIAVVNLLEVLLTKFFWFKQQVVCKRAMYINTFTVIVVLLTMVKLNI